METALYVAASLVVMVGFAHSYLGERYILIRLFRRDHLPELFGSAAFTIRTLRFAWHLTTIAWLGFAAILVLLAGSSASPDHVGFVIGCTFFIHAAITLAASRGKHLAWPVFLAIAIIAILATRI